MKIRSAKDIPANMAPAARQAILEAMGATEEAPAKGAARFANYGQITDAEVLRQRILGAKYALENGDAKAALETLSAGLEAK